MMKPAIFSWGNRGMPSVLSNQQPRSSAWRTVSALALLPGLALVLSASAPALKAEAQSNSSAAPAQQQPAASQTPQDIPDAPSTVQPPPPKPVLPEPGPDSTSSSRPTEASPRDSAQQGGEAQSPAPAPTTQSAPLRPPRNQINPAEGLYTISVKVNFVQIPVMVKDADGRRVDGLLPNDFTVLENGKKQTLTYFTSDPFQLSAAIILDVGMPDVGLQKINETYTALAGAFSPYDEVALYTYSSTVSQITDFGPPNQHLVAELNQIKLVRGGSSGPPVLGGPLASGPTVNGAPVGGPTIAPVNTPDRQSHVLNDAILRAAIDLGKRPRTRRKVIFVISDGQELGSQSNYREVLKLLQSRDIQVKAVVVDSGALPVFKQVGKIHLPSHGSQIPFLRGQGYFDILPKYSAATGGGRVFTELSRNSIEEAYTEVTNDSRNQYTLGYNAQPTSGTTDYRSVEVLVHHKGLKVSARDGYYFIPTTGAR